MFCRVSKFHAELDSTRLIFYTCCGILIIAEDSATINRKSEQTIVQKRPSLFPVSFSRIPLENGIYIDDPIFLPEGEITTLHYHDCVEVGICESGSGIIAVGECFEPVQAGDVMFIAPGHQHYSHSMDSCICRFFYVDPARYFSPVIRSGELAGRLALLQSCVLRGSRGKTVRSLINAFIRFESDPAAVEQIGLHLFQLTLELEKGHDAVYSESAAAKAAAYMRLHYGEPLKIKELAGTVYCSESSLRRQFETVYGCTPHAYLIRLRVGIGKKLLDHTAMTVAQIAAETGFGDPSEFYRSFRRIHGISPREYRRIRSR